MGKQLFQLTLTQPKPNWNYTSKQKNKKQVQKALKKILIIITCIAPAKEQNTLHCHLVMPFFRCACVILWSWTFKYAGVMPISRYLKALVLLLWMEVNYLLVICKFPFLFLRQIHSHLPLFLHFLTMNLTKFYFH